MFELKDQLGEPLFETISITLVCDDCMQTGTKHTNPHAHAFSPHCCVHAFSPHRRVADHPENCTHKLAEMPRWLSSAKMEVVKSLLSEDPAMLVRRAPSSLPTTRSPV